MPVHGLDTLEEHGSIGVRLPDGSEAFVVRHRGALFAYLNRCPHWGVDLDLGMGDFVDRRVGRIFCRNHAAEFLPDTGECVRGPCVGERLTAITIEEGALVLEGSDPDA